MTVTRRVEFVTVADGPPRLVGHGLRERGAVGCVCGTRPSGTLSTRALRAWHRDHKAELATSAYLAGRKAARFWSKVDKIPGGCWLWTAALQQGYGVFSVSRGRARRAHRWAWEDTHGPVPPGLELDHLCRVRRCVRPDHLEPVTRRVNLLRGATLPADNVRKTHCPRGHPYDEANTRWHGRQRHCRTCDRASKRRAVADVARS